MNKKTAREKNVETENTLAWSETKDKNRKKINMTQVLYYKVKERKNNTSNKSRKPPQIQRN